jgi:hypothetical protein
LEGIETARNPLTICLLKGFRKVSVPSTEGLSGFQKTEGRGRPFGKNMTSKTQKWVFWRLSEVP